MKGNKIVEIQIVTNIFPDIDPDVATHRLESMERARRRMQEQFDAQAESYAEKQKRVSD